MKRNPNKLMCETTENGEAQSIDLIKKSPRQKSITTATTESPKSGTCRSPVKKSTKISDRSPTKKTPKQLDGIEKPYSDISDLGASKLPHIVSYITNFLYKYSPTRKSKNL